MLTTAEFYKKLGLQEELKPIPTCDENSRAGQILRDVLAEAQLEFLRAPCSHESRGKEFHARPDPTPPIIDLSDPYCDL